MDHEIFDYSVEGASLVMQRSSVGGGAGFAGAELDEVFGGFGDDVFVHLHDDFSEGFFALLHVEEDLGVVLAGLEGDFEAPLLVVHADLKVGEGGGGKGELVVVSCGKLW